jgi:hypothetical protein
MAGSGLHHGTNCYAGCYGLGAIDPALYRGTLDLEEDLQFPEGHLGRIWFSLRYEPATEKLLVSLLKAKNLPSRTVGSVNSCDPFVRQESNTHCMLYDNAECYSASRAVPDSGTV